LKDVMTNILTPYFTRYKNEKRQKIYTICTSICKESTIWRHKTAHISTLFSPWEEGQPKD